MLSRPPPKGRAVNKEARRADITISKLLTIDIGPSGLYHLLSSGGRP